MNASTQTDPKVLARISKLLSLAKDGGATEGEADNAMAMAQKIMVDNNLTMAMLEASGGTGEGRSDEKLGGAAMYDYQQELMSAVSEVNFVSSFVSTKWNGKRHVPSGYRLIGRVSNVASATAMFEYLNSTINRLTKERYKPTELLSRSAVSFKHGVSRRLQERLKARHASMLAEQERDAREKTAAARHPSNTGGGTALVVVMKDFAQEEADLNNDLKRGWEPGTTETRRREREADAVEWRRKEEERVASLSSEERAAEEAEAEKASEKFWKREQARRDRYWDKRDMRAYSAGKTAGDGIGLDKQVSQTSQRRIG